MRIVSVHTWPDGRFRIKRRLVPMADEEAARNNDYAATWGRTHLPDGSVEVIVGLEYECVFCGSYDHPTTACTFDRIETQ